MHGGQVIQAQRADAQFKSWYHEIQQRRFTSARKAAHHAAILVQQFRQLRKRIVGV